MKILLKPTHQSFYVPVKPFEVDYQSARELVLIAPHMKVRFIATQGEEYNYDTAHVSCPIGDEHTLSISLPAGDLKGKFFRLVETENHWIDYVETEHTGGGCMVDFVKLKNGLQVGINDDAVVLYRGDEEIGFIEMPHD